jgi:hypothetical protein
MNRRISHKPVQYLPNADGVSGYFLELDACRGHGAKIRDLSWKTVSVCFSPSSAGAAS